MDIGYLENLSWSGIPLSSHQDVSQPIAVRSACYFNYLLYLRGSGMSCAVFTPQISPCSRKWTKNKISIKCISKLMPYLRNNITGEDSKLILTCIYGVMIFQKAFQWPLKKKKKKNHFTKVNKIPSSVGKTLFAI